jgi:tRNA-dihydrouridine synthase
MSKVPAHFELIPDIVALRDEVSPETLLVINGDVRDRAHGLEFFEQYGVDGVMIGRGIFTNPYAFSDRAEKPTHEELLSLLHEQLNLFDVYQPQMGRPFETLKRFFKIYIRDFDGASDLRDRLMHTKSTDEVRAILRNIS